MQEIAMTPVHAGFCAGTDVLIRHAAPLCPEPAADPFLPSVYTGLIVQALQQRAAIFNKGTALDIGVGSGVLLMALAALGVRRLTGMDIDPDAIRRAAKLLGAAGLADRTELLTGSMWDGLDGRTFDVITANLPAFPAAGPCDPDRAAQWSCGGTDGRRFMDPFITGLSRHLAPGGTAFVAHNVCLGRTRTDSLLHDHGLIEAVLLRTSIPLDPRKSAFMTPAIRKGGPGTGILRFGSYEFMDVEVLEIQREQLF
jgi:release factor glutamine methyltransferase